MSLRILQIASDARWVRMGNPPLRRFGVPEGGPYDRESWAWCAALAQADRAIEIGPFGASFLCEGAVSVAITGAERMLQAGSKRIGNGLHTLEAGEALELGSVTRGARSYVALGKSREDETPLARNAVLTGKNLGHTMPLGGPAPSLSDGPIRVLSGPQADQFDLHAFTGAEWRVSLEADRVGLRLSGPTTNSKTPLGEMASEPQTVGTIQITRGGTPIVIGPDGPTIGGYPKIALVIDADRDRLGQLVPNALVRFVLVDMAAARDLGRAYRARLRDALAMRIQRP